MSFHPIQLVAYLLAAVLGNLWLATLLAVPLVRPREARTRARLWGSGIAGVVAMWFAVFAMGQYRSEDGFLLLVLYLPVQALVTTRQFFRYNRQRGRPVSWRRLLTGNLLVLGMLMTSGLAIGEVWFRFGRDTTDSIGYTKIAQRWLARHYVLNSHGFRDNVEYALPRVAGKRRISFFGDSFTAGHGIDDVDQRFANRIRRARPEWDVHVAARNGDDTGAAIRNLTLAMANGYAVDQVVLVYCLNDIQDLATGWQATADLAKQRAETRWGAFGDSYFLDTLYYRVAISSLPGIGDYFSSLRDAYRGPVWEQQQQRFLQFREVVQKAGGTLRVVTWPFLHALGEDYQHEEAHAQLGQFWRQQGIEHLDLLPLLREYPSAKLTVNAFDAHPNEFASELAAVAIERWLAGLVGK